MPQAFVVQHVYKTVTRKNEKTPSKSITWGLHLVEAVRFELTEGINPRRFSRPVHSTALPRFQAHYSNCVITRLWPGKAQKL